MTSGPIHTKSASQGAPAAEKSDPFPNFGGNGREMKVRFEDTGKAAGVGGVHDSGVPAKVKQHNHHHHQRGMTMVERPTLTSRLPEGVVILKDQQTGELPAFGEHRFRQQQGVGNEGQGNRRLRGKLKWLFEQDRVYWESNSAKSSSGGSPEAEHRRGLKPEITETTTGGQQQHYEGEPNAEGEIRVQKVRKESMKNVDSDEKLQGAHLRRRPRRASNDGAKGVREDCDVSPRDNGCSNNFALSKAAPWAFGGTAVKFWSRKSKAAAAAQDSKAAAPQPAAEGTAQGNGNGSHAAAAATERRASVEHQHSRRLASKESATLMSSVDLGRDGFFSDGSKEEPDSGDDTTDPSISDEDEENDGAGRRPDASREASLKDVKHQAAYLKAKCEVLGKEKALAVEQWQASRVEIDEAAQLAQALRTGIETLLEAGASNSRSDFKARQDILEEETETLKRRMEKLRKKDSEGLVWHSQSSKRPNRTLHDRIYTLRETAERRSLTSPEIPRDTEHKVEALRARLEKLMLATNCRVIDEQGQATRIPKGHEKTAQNSQSKEKGELKIKGWLNSLSAEWKTDGSLLTKVCETCKGTQGGYILTEMEVEGTPAASKQNTPVASEQGSPAHPAHEPERDDPESSGSGPSSEETKKMVIHKIAEEVRLEAKQWFQVQELLGRVGEDMKSLQEACSTWERRAIIAETQVAFMQQEEQEKSKRIQGFGDDKVAELQQEMSGIRQTVDEVRMRLGGNVGLDPNKWFEAAQKFGYAFVPVNIPHMRCGCKGKCKSPSVVDEGTPDSTDQMKHKGTVALTSRIHNPSSSTNSSTAPSAISSSANTPSEIELRWRPQQPGQQSACEAARTDEETKPANWTAPSLPSSEAWSEREVTRYVQVDNGSVKETYNAPDGGRRLFQEKQQQTLLSKLRLESSGSRGDVLQSTTRERRGVLHQQDEQVARYTNFSGPGSRRSPLRDVLENITSSSKENKQPSL